MWPTNMYIVSKSCFQYDFIAYKIWPPSANPSAGPRFPNTTREDDAKPKSRAFFKCMCHWNLKELQIKQRWMFSKNQANSLIQLPWGDVVSGHQKKGWPMLTGYINLNLLEGCNRITYLPQDHLIKIHKVTIPSENWFHVSSFSGRTCWTLIYVIFIYMAPIEHVSWFAIKSYHIKYRYLRLLGPAAAPKRRFKIFNWHCLVFFRSFVFFGNPSGWKYNIPKSFSDILTGDDVWW